MNNRYTCKFSLDNEYIKRMIKADNGLFDSMIEMKRGNKTPYKEYFTKITKGSVCDESVVNFWTEETFRSKISGSLNPPYLWGGPPISLLNGVHNDHSMNIDHDKLFYGDVFLIDGNHRITSSMIRGEEPIVIFNDSGINNEWRNVLEAKTDPNYRIKHQPHPHPVLWDLKSYRTMDSCKARYGALADSGIKSTYEIGCAEGVGIWILNERGVNSTGSEINQPSRTLAKSLTKIDIDPEATPKSVPDAECLILYSVLYHLLRDSSKAEQWISRIKQFPCVALELSTDSENLEKERYFHMSKYNPLDWWPNKKLIYVDKLHANRETWLLWK